MFFAIGINCDTVAFRNAELDGRGFFGVLPRKANGHKAMDEFSFGNRCLHPTLIVTDSSTSEIGPKSDRSQYRGMIAAGSSDSIAALI